ncbi:MAG: MATE family efflux transporter, partial [Lachnospiraceae bacterium]|nr:MATE family efflux transporter [Lachnospiraceae bacterium]
MQKVNFENGNITSNILQTAFPMLVAQVLSLLYNIVDRIYIGRIPGTGTEALGAVGFCFPVIIIVTAFTNMFGMGGAPLFSMELGKKEPEKAAAILNTSLRLLILSAVIITVSGIAFARPLLVTFGAGSEELFYARPYLQIYLVGTIFSMISTGINPYINAEGYSVFGMITVMIGALANLALDPVFIFAFGLGVQGAAIATVISQILSASFVIWFLRSSRNEFRIHWKKSADGRWFPYGGKIVSLGLTPFIMQVTNSLVSLCCNSMLMRWGGTMYVSAMTTVSSVRQILDTPVMAITEGTSPAISYNYGARRPKRIKKAVRVMMSLALPYTILIWAL